MNLISAISKLVIYAIKLVWSLNQIVNKSSNNSNRLVKQTTANEAVLSPTMPIPRIIWILWLQGWDQSPEIVRACLATWRHHNPDWTIHTLTASNLHQFLNEETFLTTQGKNIQAEALSNVIRLALLQRYGGVWVDSTLYCLRPLNEWLSKNINNTGFFAFARPGRGRMLSTWFLAASKENYIVQQWLDRTQQYWKDRTERHRYFWVHGLFEECYNTNQRFRKLWDSTLKVSAGGPHFYTPYKNTLHRSVSRRDRALFDTAAIPVLKLTHKLTQPEYRSDSVLRYLCDRANELSQNEMMTNYGTTASL